MCPLLFKPLLPRYPRATLDAACSRRTIDQAAIFALEHSLRWSADVGWHYNVVTPLRDSVVFLRDRSPAGLQVLVPISKQWA
jgi:hypothetical protein